MILQAYRQGVEGFWCVDHGTSSGSTDAAVAPGRCCPLAVGWSALWGCLMCSFASQDFHGT